MNVSCQIYFIFITDNRSSRSEITEGLVFVTDQIVTLNQMSNIVTRLHDYVDAQSGGDIGVMKSDSQLSLQSLSVTKPLADTDSTIINATRLDDGKISVELVDGVELISPAGLSTKAFGFTDTQISIFNEVVTFDGIAFRYI